MDPDGGFVRNTAKITHRLETCFFEIDILVFSRDGSSRATFRRRRRIASYSCRSVRFVLPAPGRKNRPTISGTATRAERQRFR